MKKGEMPAISACVMWTPPCFAPNARNQRRRAAPSAACVVRTLIRKCIKGPVEDRFRPKAQHVAIRVLDMHFECPGVVPRRVTDLGSTRTVLCIEILHILDADPRPGTRTALSPTT